MKHFLSILFLIFMIPVVYIASENFTPSEPSLESDDALEQWVENLEPICEFEVTEEYPNVILELFNLLIEQKNTMTEGEKILDATLNTNTVYGSQDEFCVIYTFSGELEYLTRSGDSANELFDEMTMDVRMRQKNRTTYELVAQGGGPIAYGLEQTGLTLESLE